MWKLGFVSNQMVTGKEAEAGRRWSGPGISRSGAGGAAPSLPHNYAEFAHLVLDSTLLCGGEWT